MYKDKMHITKIKFNNVEIADPLQIANTFNQYSSEIGQNLVSNIPPSQKQFFDFLDHPNPNSIFFVPVHRNEIIDIHVVHNQKNKKKVQDTIV